MAILIALAYNLQHSQIAQAQSGFNLAEHSIISTVTVTNGSATSFTNPLDRANFIQITLNQGDAQAFTYCPPVGACADVPSGQGFQIGKLRREIPGGTVLGTVQTATDGATLQIVAQRVD